MLETIRQYARDKLLESGEGEPVRARHLAFYVGFVESFKSIFYELRAFRSIETEHDNVRTAIDWALESRDGSSSLRLGYALSAFWQQRMAVEGVSYLREILSRPEAAGRTTERTRALIQFGTVLSWHGNDAAARPVLEEGLAIAREMANERLICRALVPLTLLAFGRNDLAVARAFASERLVLARKADDRYEIARALFSLGYVALHEDDTEQAEALFTESTAILKPIGDKYLLASILRRWGRLKLRRGDYSSAGAYIRESLTTNSEIEDKRGVGACLAAWAALTAARGQAVDAIRFCGCVDALLAAMHTGMGPLDRGEHERNLATLRAQFDPGTFAAAWTEGRAMSMEQAIALALEERKHIG